MSRRLWLSPFVLVLVLVSMALGPRSAGAERVRGATIALDAGFGTSYLGAGLALGVRPGLRLTRTTSMELNLALNRHSGGYRTVAAYGFTPGLRFRAAVDFLTPFIGIHAGPSLAVVRDSRPYRGIGRGDEVRVVGTLGAAFGVEIAFHDQFGFGPQVSISLSRASGISQDSVTVGFVLYSGGGPRRARFYGRRPRSEVMARVPPARG